MPDIGGTARVGTHVLSGNRRGPRKISRRPLVNRMDALLVHKRVMPRKVAENRYGGSGWSPNKIAPRKDHSRGRTH